MGKPKCEKSDKDCYTCEDDLKSNCNFWNKHKTAMNEVKKKND